MEKGEIGADDESAVAEDRLETAVERSSVGERCQTVCAGDGGGGDGGAGGGRRRRVQRAALFDGGAPGEVGEPTGEGIYLLVLFFCLIFLDPHSSLN